MERTCNYPIEIKFKIDLNTELLLNELCDLLKKDRSKILRLIIADFFDRNLDLIDKYKETDNKLDREKLVEAISATIFCPLSKMMQRLEVVPWSSAMTYCFILCASFLLCSLPRKTARCAFLHVPYGVACGGHRRRARAQGGQHVVFIFDKPARYHRGGIALAYLGDDARHNARQHLDKIRLAHAELPGQAAD